MRIPLTKYGLREILVFGGLALVAVVICVALGVPWLAPVPAVPLLFVVAFFRDPNRKIPDGEGVIVAPADGKVVAVGDMDHEEFIDGPAVRLDIFLAVYNVHVNRAPIAGEVRYLKDRDGPYLNALKLSAGKENQARSVGLVARDGGFRFVVRQIVGAIARRIVTGAKEGDSLARGERFFRYEVGDEGDA